MPQTAYRVQAQVDADGTLAVRVPLPPGTPVEVVVLTAPPDASGELVDAAANTTGFWDNALDEEDWNDA